MISRANVGMCLRGTPGTNQDLNCIKQSIRSFVAEPCRNICKVDPVAKADIGFNAVTVSAFNLGSSSRVELWS
jgi:hypothetical protein